MTIGGRTFDQLFFIVDNDQHEVLFSLPTITAAGMHLTTADGVELLPDLRDSLTLDLGGTGPLPQIKPLPLTMAKLLNDAATAYRNRQTAGENGQIDPYNPLYQG